MIYISYLGTKIEICSPKEVIRFRENRSTGKPFVESQKPPLDIAKKITQIYKVHGYANEENCLNLLSKVDYDLLFNYDFSSGYQYTSGPLQFPIHIQNDEESIHKAIAYARMILEAIGWIVTFKEGDLYHFNLAPLLALTPEEVSIKIQQRIKTLAANALQVINKGLVNHKHQFSRKDVGLTPAKCSAKDAELVIARLRNLLGNQWFIKDWDGYNFEVVPNPNPGW